MAGLGAVIVAPAVQAQTAKVARIGLLGNVRGPAIDAFLGGLRDLGWVEGRNIVIESRWAEGNLDRLPALAAELAHLNVDLIATAGTPAIQAVQRATATIPIVMSASADAVGTGLVAGLARPGGHTTGLTILIPELSATRLELLKQLVPNVRRIGVLWNATGPAGGLALKATEAAAQNLGLQVDAVEVRDPDALDAAFTTLAKGRAEALFIVEGPVLIALRSRIVELALKHRLPTIAPLREFADAGGLVAYGPSLVDMFRRSATYVDKILKGAKAADLPIEQPTRFELVINMKTAKALGLVIPKSLLLRADEVIQ